VLSQIQADIVVLDCMTLLVSNVIAMAGEMAPIETSEARVQTEVDGILGAFRSRGFTLIVVSNEVGLGIVPAYPLGRVYRDLLGWANQILARAADEVYFLAAGLPLALKPPGDGLAPFKFW
jgi:adenosylcobinamide kinase/adenosylcobinamide-phosphate guanylyltransferase